jgi:hypothetical protein
MLKFLTLICLIAMMGKILISLFCIVLEFIYNQKIAYNVKAVSYCWDPTIGTPSYKGASTGDLSSGPTATFCTV